MTKAQEELILNVLTNESSFNYWGRGLVKQYIDELRESYGDIPKRLSDINLSSFVIDWVKHSDKDLRRFLQINKNFEQNRPKSSELIQMDQVKKDVLSAIKGSFSPVEYDPINAGKWKKPKLVYAVETARTFEFWYAVAIEKNANQIYKASELKPEVLQYFKQEVSENHLNFKKINKVSVVYSTYSRFINTVTVNKTDGHIIFTTDYPKAIDPDDEEKHTIPPSIRLEKFREEFIQSIKCEEPEKVKKELKENSLITEENIGKLRASDDTGFLIIPFQHIREHEGDVPEEIIINGKNISIATIRKYAREYYTKHGGFNKFLNEYSQFDLFQGGETDKLVRERIDGIKMRAKGILLATVSEIDDSVNIEIKKIEINCATKSIYIHGNKGGTSIDSVYSKLAAIFSR